VFTVDGLPGAEFTGDLDLISPVVDQATGSFRARFRVRKPDARKLKPGMFVRAKILTEQLRDALMAPKAAVLADGDSSCVMCIRGGAARKVVFDPGLQDRDFVEVRRAATTR
jgi:multidrug efflux pump subunit AcrA (membrane-fusion protein)